jgi:hypothetical protein
VDRFIAGKIGSEAWASWKENVGSWMTRDQDPGFLLLRYEDLINDTRGELARLADFLRIKHDPAILDRVIERSSADQMRKLEKEDAQVWIGTRNRRQDIPMVGVATSDGWQKRLPSSCVAKIESAWGDLMERVGYSSVTLKTGAPMGYP